MTRCDTRLSVIGLGAGGHAGVLIDVLRASDCYRVHSLLDASPRRHGTQVLGIPVVGGDEQLDALRADGIEHVFNGVGTARNTRARRHVWDNAREKGFEFIDIIDKSAIVSQHATIGPGVTILARAVINTQATLGANVVVNTGAIVEHDCVLADHVHVASGAVLAGGVLVEAGAFLGAGCCIQPGIRIGAEAVVGTGAVVVRDVEPKSVVVGVPARPLPNEERSWMIQRAS